MKSIIKIGIAIREQLLANSISIALEKQSEFAVIFDTENTKQLQSELASRSIRPNVLLLGIEYPVHKTIKTLKEIGANYPNLKVIVLGNIPSQPLIISVIENGSAAYIMRNKPLTHLINVVKEVIKNGFYYDDFVFQSLRNNLMGKNKIYGKHTKREIPITKREKEVLTLICKEYTTSEIAKKLYISTRTVEGHRKNLLGKTNSRNTAGLVIFACQNRLVNFEPEGARQRGFV